MKVWVDADACPLVLKEILFRAAERTGVLVTLVANQPVRIPSSRVVKKRSQPMPSSVCATMSAPRP